MEKDMKELVASNLVIASFLRDLLFKGTGGEPVKNTDDVIRARFEKYIKLIK